MGGPIKCKAALGGAPPLPSRPILAQESLHGSEEFGGGCGLWRALRNASSGCAREEAALGWFKARRAAGDSPGAKWPAPELKKRSQERRGRTRTKGELTRKIGGKRRERKMNSKEAREGAGAAPRPSRRSKKQT